MVVNTHEAKANLSRLVKRVERGEEVVIGPPRHTDLRGSRHVNGWRLDTHALV